MPLDPRIASELRAVHAQLTSGTDLLPNAQLDALYETFRAKFGPDTLQALDGEDLLRTMHCSVNNDCLTAALLNTRVFKSHDPYLGGKLGGPSNQFKLRFRTDTSTWVTGSTYPGHEVQLDEAINIAQEQRRELVAGAQLLDELSMQAGDEEYLQLQAQMNVVAPTLGEFGWARKYFTLLYPEKLDEYNWRIADGFDYHVWHLARLLDMPPPGQGKYVCAGHFVAIASELRLRMNQVTTVIGDRNGRTPYHYWRIGTTEGSGGTSHATEMIDGGYVAIGWDEIGDLSRLISYEAVSERKTAIKQLLEQKLPERFADAPAGNAVGQIHSFLAAARKGDIVLASEGAVVLAVGRLTGPYNFAAEGRFRHRRPVDWLSTDSWSLPINEQLRTTFRLLNKPANLLEAEKRILGATIRVNTQAVTTMRPTPALTGIPARIDSILKRKGQVILHGPPGTGKTYWAEIAARELASRSWFDKAFQELTETERAEIEGTEEGTRGAVRMCSFHPAYGYEDFLEGYRPESPDGQMIFCLRDGIFKRLCADAGEKPDRDFFLIIDEINRGDIPRIFGELLTVMERNKRGKSVLLPLTGTPFRVPRNVLIIGTMNTADRSIALLDAALRRRFGFIELMPDSALLDGVYVGTLPLRHWFEALNGHVKRHLGRDGRNLQIGHSYLLLDDGQVVRDPLHFARILEEDIIPLLQEYCYDDYEALARILGSLLVESSAQRIRSELFHSSRVDELIRAVLAHHPELSAYGLASEPIGGDSDPEDDEDLAEDGDFGDPLEATVAEPDE